MSAYELIAYLEIFGLQRHLSLDVGGDENVLKIHPLALRFHPLLHDFHYQLNVLGKLLCTWLDRPDVAIGKSVVDVGQRLIQDNSELVNLSQHKSVLVGLNHHVRLQQCILDLAEGFLQVLFLQSLGRNFNQIRRPLLYVECEQLFQCQGVVLLVEGGLENLANFLNVLFLEIV
jgi:hypothetical protein